MPAQPNKYSEKETQDYAADFYEDIRYRLPASRQYYDWFFHKLFACARPYGRILDNGCGNGIVGEYLCGADIVGIDLSPRMAEYARKRLPRVEVGDSQHLPFPDGSFDTVVSLSLLHHLSDPKQGIAEVARILKPGGLAIFEDVVKTALSVVPRYFLNRKSSHFSHEHKNFFKSELLRLISTFFQVEHIHHYGYLGYPLLGFPDIINFQKYIPTKKLLIPALLAFDDFVEKIPFIRTQSWNIIVIARRT
ncbi:MAG: hypothetical protein A2722_02855 [Candidatus Doudnabacteria bacterium RIFCSPHIGHO2_01_FULL_50_11]|uniref:Methyltransferase type 11 domain-containing protein n=1 Tax=Candidatus Doudnabacteria bacterium RIFCSPHIGHO2_01_FULL_50_11 TaxID=1817828 RepID=A0A1F5PHB1_9BACT|nr:MAG: hypothetical protein A2722_02855 [Candidatus Doudnabacteria bacterium RIFCSPHIGHO2_01_FULL_50_11]HLC44235.1 class I SAM-dependent methyltransferase [Patescibacteria group bacterium]